MRIKPQRQSIYKTLRWGLVLITGLVLVAVILAFSMGSAFVAQRLNPVNIGTLQPLSQDAQALHQSLTIADLHADSLLWGRDLSQQANYGHVDIPRLMQGNVAVQVFTVVTKVPEPLQLQGNHADSDSIIKLAILQRWPLSTWFSLKARALYQAKQFHRFEHQNSQRFTIIKTQKDLREYLSFRQQHPQATAGLLGLEGTQALEGNIKNLDRLYQAGFRIIGLAHFFDNEVSGSAHGITNSGLTPLGRSVLNRIDDLHLIVDLAHASSTTLDQVLRLTNRPVLVSHTGVKGTCDNPRNLSD
jgi:membrane dipeptidase